MRLKRGSSLRNKPINKRKLQALINKTAKASTAFTSAAAELGKFENEHWGFEHGDRGLDSIIDGVCGGCGVAGGMDVEDYIALMDGAA
jgi:hypothetical protein